MSGKVSGGAMVFAAAVVAVLGVPAWVVRLYGARLYPAWQAVMTPLSNAVPLPLFDLAVGTAVAAALVAGGVSARRAWRRRSVRPLLRLAGATLVGLAVAYLWFLAAWGLNYRRPGVEHALDRFDSRQATPARVRALADLAVARTNRLHAEAHAVGFPALEDVPRPLLESLHAVERRLGRPRPTVPSRPKLPLSAPYLRAVGISGMLAPLFLETYVNPDLTGPERPAVLAHEWAHLSGFAPEEDASFVGLAAALGADVASRYSAWLAIVMEAAARLQPVTRQVVLAALDAGPRADLDAIAARQHLRVPWLDRASWVAYDRAIKSQGAAAGVAGYGRVIELLLGSDLLAGEGLTE